jgi:hypothetical protein
MNLLQKCQYTHRLLLLYYNRSSLFALTFCRKVFLRLTALESYMNTHWHDRLLTDWKCKAESLEHILLPFAYTNDCWIAAATKNYKIARLLSSYIGPYEFLMGLRSLHSTSALATHLQNISFQPRAHTGLHETNPTRFSFGAYWHIEAQ